MKKTWHRTSCDSCKRMKLKCDKQENRCTRCEARGTECEVTLVKRKQREKKKKSHYVSAIEDRMIRMEKAINESGLNLNIDNEDPEPNTGISRMDVQSELSDSLSMLVVTDNGDSAFLGASSGFSIFSPQGLKWVSEKIDGDSFGDLLKTFAECNKCDTDTASSNLWHFRPFEKHHPLPPVEVAMKYVDVFFHNLNSMFPLYSEVSFREKYAKIPFPTPEKDTAWYASLNVVIGIGQIISAQNLETNEMCLAHFRNAASTYVDLVFNHSSLDAIQALLGMAIIMQAVEEPQPAYVLSASAARMAQSIGLHQRVSASRMNPSETETRRNVFWICYIIDKGIGLRHGRPSIFHDDDIGIELPEKKTKTLCNPSNLFGLSTFYYMSTLALLESCIYNQLYSVRSRTQSELQRLRTVGNLDIELSEWLETVPVEIRPGQPIICEKKDIGVVIIMHFAYYNSLTAIHRESVHYGSWTTKEGPAINLSQSHNKQINTRVFKSAKICLDAARTVIKLLHYYRPSDGLPISGLTSMVNWYPLTASLTLFASILQAPDAPNASSDLALMTSVVEFFSDVLIYPLPGTDLLASHNRLKQHGLALTAFREISRLAAVCIEKATLRLDASIMSELEKPGALACSSLGNAHQSLQMQNTANSNSNHTQIARNGNPPGQYVFSSTADYQDSNLSYNPWQLDYFDDRVLSHGPQIELSASPQMEEMQQPRIGNTRGISPDGTRCAPYVPMIFEWDFASLYTE